MICMLTFKVIGQLHKIKKAPELTYCSFIEAIFVSYYIYIFFSLKAFKILVFEADQQMRIYTESSNDENENDEKCIDSVELLGIDIGDFKDSSSVEDGMVDAYNTSSVRFKTISFQHFWWCFNSDATAQCASDDLILKTSNGDACSLNAVFNSTSLEYCIISCKRSSEIR